MINSRMDFVLTLTKNTLFVLMAATVGMLSTAAASAQTGKGAMLAKQANHVTMVQPDTVVRAEKLHPSANRSYKVAGKSYQPLTKVAAFSQSGNASWYGNQFHGRKTASGERYDMYALTAAHRTLPIPSYARVTNTQNGKSVIVRINDRGPFHGSRVMDLSKAAAQRLGFINQGTARVKIEQIVPGINSAQATAKAKVPTLLTPASPMVSVPPKEIYVELKSFGTERDAEAYISQASQNLNAAHPKLSVEKRSHEYVVRMGPFSAQESADEAANRVRNMVQYNGLSAI